MFYFINRNIAVLMEESEYVTLIVNVPNSHGDLVRKALGDAGAGDVNGYSHCSFSFNGKGRFKPKPGSEPFIGKEGEIETVLEEQIQTCCKKNDLEEVLKALKEAHPYEETIIDIFPIYKLGLKKGKK